MPRLLVIGSINYDLILTHSRFPEAGETVVGASLVQTPGGKGANQAIAAARAAAILGLDLEVRLVAAVGDDDFGSQQLRQLQTDGVDVSSVMRVHRPTGLSTIWVDAVSGQNRILNAPGANLELQPAHLDDRFPEHCDLVLLQNELAPETTRRAAELAASRGIPIVWDPAPFPAGDTPPMPVEIVDFTTPNENEAAALLGRALGREPEFDAQELHAQGYGSVLLTLGEGGVVSCGSERGRPGHALRLRAPTVEAVDTTGAGDAFSGSFAAARLAGLDLREALEFALRFASGSVTRRGAQVSFPTCERELADF